MKYILHVPVYQKTGAKAIKSLDEFRDKFVFDYKYTNKNLCVYNDEMKDFELIDYKGKKLKVNDKFGVILVPTTYELRQITRI